MPSPHPHLPFLAWPAQWREHGLRGDLVAGITVALVLIPPLAGLFGTGQVPQPPVGFGTGGMGMTIAITCAKVAAFVAIMLIVGRRAIPAILHYAALTGQRGSRIFHCGSFC